MPNTAPSFIQSQILRELSQLPTVCDWYVVKLLYILIHCTSFIRLPSPLSDHFILALFQIAFWYLFLNVVKMCFVIYLPTFFRYFFLSFIEKPFLFCRVFPFPIAISHFELFNFYSGGKSNRKLLSKTGKLKIITAITAIKVVGVGCDQCQSTWLDPRTHVCGDFPPLLC